ncbi:bifunctional 5,10-methylenetetrahydrofolate dehydrogenase/5,10-methenyltetrahydrofolate cyclohydrolase [Actinomarinicola tropica]|uniref:Bifunctional protein FolD n=1 Tax=Actinomarinicola tropica TaxID=2789776 RepID=A0A5Q2RHB2_9ACTN|nr:tetrahydrofolate dehydrogenase/cyclohydrolase catalytic domain-containing protein [Actinomarinicola tropica]QGG93931.1 bifunctional 5,10-methylenetetrahydrofolate dehydrogenase/5,10-methenyltetrahydrofolate cyclohydrolase [Actinomarinicola tropica]
MTAQVLDGEVVAARIKDDLARRIAVLRDQGVTPGLGTILVGDDGPSANYVAMKHRDCEAIGMESFHRHLPADSTQHEVEAAVDAFNENPEVDAYLMQYPFPAGLDFEAALLRMDPAKDVDGLHPVNLGKLVMGTVGPRPCTPVGIVELLRAYDIDLKGAHVVVVGRGLTIGRPLANLLTLKEPGLNAAVTVVHTGVDDIGSYTREADVLVAAAGSPGLVTADMVRPGAVVVAAGVSFQGRKLLSDVADDVAEVASWLSPRMGGVGPMTRAMLLSNCVEAAERRAVGRG